MLPTVLKGQITKKQSILIIRTFQKMRHYLMENKQLLNSMENRLDDSEQSISKIESTMTTKDDIQNIIDNYISIKTLSHLKHKKDGVDVVIFTTNAKRRDTLRKVELDDFNAQYPALLLKNNPISHDRYIILDYNTKNGS